MHLQDGSNADKTVHAVAMSQMYFVYYITVYYITVYYITLITHK